MGEEYRLLCVGSGGRETEFMKHLYYSKKSSSFLACLSTFKQHEMQLYTDEYFLMNKHYTSQIHDICKSYNIKYVFLGSENYLHNDLVNTLENNDIFCIAPNYEYAKIETSKIYARNLLQQSFLRKYNPDYIMVSNSTPFTTINSFLEKHNNQIVVKPDGLTGGKGVKVYGTHMNNKEVILEYVSELLKESEFSVVLLEEKCTGREYSFISFTDGFTLLHGNPIMDFKRRNNGNVGPNTGSMGCICEGQIPHFLTEEDIETSKKIQEEVVSLLQKQNHNYKYAYYKGFLYGSFIKTWDGTLKIIEFNARLGDPEAIPFLHHFDINWWDACVALKTRTLHNVSYSLKKDCSYITYLVHKDYPKKTTPSNFTLHTVNEKNKPYLTFGSVECNDGEYTALCSRNIAICFHGSTLNALYDKSCSIVDSILKENPYVFHYRNDLLYEYYSSYVHEKCDYKNAGVNVELGNQVISQIAPYVKDTYNSSVLNEIGSFGGCFGTKEILEMYKEPVLVSSIDGVGTKSTLVINYLGVKGYESLGHDIVNHCINDILVQGAKPLYFLDYIASSVLEPQAVVNFVKGISDACKESHCVLMGGETAEMPQIYAENKCDLVGCITGVVEKGKIINGINNVKEGDILIGIPSSGPHTNGYSLLRKCLQEHPKEMEELLPDLCKPHRSYLKEFNILQKENIPIHGLCHITGGGFKDNLKRIMNKSLTFNLTLSYSELFKKVQMIGNYSNETMEEVFNCGWGLILCVPNDEVVVSTILGAIDDAKQIGSIIKV